MSSEPTLTIAGNNDLTTDTARHAMSAGFGDPVYLWRTIEDPIIGTSPIVILADEEERAAFARLALDAGIPVVSLPINKPDEGIEKAILEGRLKFISTLHGLPTLSRLAADCRAERYGRRYGIFAAHRLPRGLAAVVDESLCDLLVYITSLIERPLVRLSATTSTLGGSATSAWFILARFADDTIATIEAGAMLPDADDSNGELVVEVTGSDAVLRAEPERQSVVVNGNEGYQRQAWYADPPEFLLHQALQVLNSSDVTPHVSALRLLQQRFDAGTHDMAVPVQTPD